MKHYLHRVYNWIKQSGYQDSDESLSALYIQAISLLIITSAIIIGIVYVFEGQSFYVTMTILEMVVFGIVIVLVRLRKLWVASNLFLIAALGLLSFGIYVAGGIHSSTSLMFPVILVFASILLGRRSFIAYSALCVAVIGFIIFAENQGLTPVPYEPDPPEFPLFVTYSLIVVTAGVVVRSITESLQNSSLKARQYAQEVLTQKSMLDRVGQAVVGCKLDNTITYWNQAAVELYGWTEKEALGKQYYDLVPTNLTSEMAEEIQTALRRGDNWNGDMVFRNKDQEKLQVLGTVAPLQDETGAVTGWIGIAADLSEHKQVEVELRKRESILEAVTFAAEQFLKTSDWRENIDRVLERLGRATNATHAYLFEDHINVQGEPVTSMRYEWTAPGYPSDMDGRSFQNSLIHQDGFEEQVEKLQRGDVRMETFSTFNSIEKESAEMRGIKSILEVPVFVGGREWGAIGFDDFENEREWSPAEVDALKIAAGILSGTIQRQEVESAISESERVYRQAIQASGAIPYYLDFRTREYTFMGEKVERLTGYAPSELTPDLWEQMERQRVTRGSMAHLTYEEADRLTEAGILRHWECDYLIVNRHEEEKWVSDSCVQILDENGERIGVVGILQDITDRKLIEAGLRKRESLLGSVTFSAEQFLKSPDWRRSINAVLERLGREFNASHAYLFERHAGSDGLVMNSMRYEWVAPGQRSDMDNPEYQNAGERGEEFKQYYEILYRGEPFIGSASRITDGERVWLNGVGIKALLEMRIIVDGRQWGTLGFDDTVNEREWTSMEVDVLKVAANVLGAAIKRQLDEDALKNELAERKRAETALKFSERKFSKAFHTTHVLTTIEDENHILVDANHAFLDAFGFERDQVVGRSVPELNILFNNNDLAALRQAYCDSGGLKDYEMRIRRKSGEVGYILLSSDRIDIDDAEFTLTSGLDITERKLSEVALRESEARFRSLFEQSHDAVFMLDLSGRHITANQRAAEMLGYTVEEMQNLAISDLSAEMPESEKIMQQLLAGEHIPTYERLFRKKNGDIFPVEVSVELVRDDKGAPLHIQSVVRDVTQRKFSELQIRRQAARAEVLASLSQLLTKVTQDQRMVFDAVVRRCAELIGDGASIFLYSAENEFLELTAVYNPDPQAMEVFWDEISQRPIRWNEGAYAKAIGEVEPVLIPFVPIEELIKKAPPDRREYYKKLPIHSMMLAPLHVQGKVMGVIGMARHSPGRDYTPEDLTFLQDIADRSALAMLNAQYYRELEQELLERKRAEEKYRDIFNNSIDGIFQSTEDGRFLSANPAMARIYGFDSPEDMIASISNIAAQLYVNADQRNELQRRLSSGERVVGFETLDYRKDGATFWASMSVQGIRDENGNILFYEGSVEDITPRKEAEADREKLIKELAEKNAEAETLRETTSIVTSTLDVSEAVQRILEQLKRVVPYDSASVWLYDGNTARMVGLDGLPDLQENDMIYTIDESEPDHPFISDDVPYILIEDIQEKYTQFRRPPINYIRGWLSVALKARGKLIGFISLDSRQPGRFSDRDARLALNFANQVAVALENAHLFSDLQKELDGREKLIDELENKNAELEQFTYTVSHDLKSPLVTINGFLGYLEQDAASGNVERLKKDIQRIQEAVLKMQRLLNELLELSRIGRMMNAPVNVPFNELVKEALDIVHGQLEAKGVAVHTHPNLPLVHGDKPRLMEVLQNLIDNAAKYMGDQKNPQIEIGQYGNERGKPVFYVKDNGMGIESEHHERIFGLFNKLDARSEGTGVGLALVKRIVEIHGGRIWVESEPGKGSTFLFTLPPAGTMYPKPEA